MWLKHLLNIESDDDWACLQIYSRHLTAILGFIFDLWLTVKTCKSRFATALYTAHTNIVQNQISATISRVQLTLLVALNMRLRRLVHDNLCAYPIQRAVMLPVIIILTKIIVDQNTRNIMARWQAKLTIETAMMNIIFIGITKWIPLFSQCRYEHQLGSSDRRHTHSITEYWLCKRTNSS